MKRGLWIGRRKERPHDAVAHSKDGSGTARCERWNVRKVYPRYHELIIRLTLGIRSDSRDDAGMALAQDLLDTFKAKSGTPDHFRRAVEEIVRSYRHSWDVLGELVQNAVDAIRREAKSQGKGYEGELTIHIDSTKLEVVVKDNGCGLAPEDIPHALIPSGSFKSLGKDLGYKGFGLTFVCFSSQRFEMSTVRDGTRTKVVMKNNIDWLADPSNDELPALESETEEECDEENGTVIRVQLASGQYESKFKAIAALDGFFEWAVQQRALEYVLRTRTAVGWTGSVFGRKVKPPIKVKLRIDGKKPVAIPFRYLLPSDAEYVKKSYYDDITAYAKRYVDGKLSRESKRFRGLSYLPPTFTIGTHKPFDASCAIVVCGRTGMSKLAEEFGVTDSIKDRIKLSTGVHLALGGMPTGITIDDWEGRGGFEQRFFALIDADLVLSEQLDAGRKGISYYFVRKLVDETLESINAKVHGANKDSLRTFSRMMVEPSGSAGPSGDLGEDAQTYVKLRQKAKRHALKEVLAIPYSPVDENEVIALFFDLVGRQLLPGYEVRYLSQYAKYDAAFSFRVRLDEKLLNPTHPLGLGDAARMKLDAGETEYQWTDTKGTDWFVAEFKPTVEDLVVDRKKALEEIELLIAWDGDKERLENEFDASLEKIEPGTRRLFGVTHRLTFEGKDCDCILLKTVISRLEKGKKGKKV